MYAGSAEMTHAPVLNYVGSVEPLHVPVLINVECVETIHVAVMTEEIRMNVGSVEAIPAPVRATRLIQRPETVISQKNVFLCRAQESRWS